MNQFIETRQALILASASEIRKTILTNAGLKFKSGPADIDEESIRAKLGIENPGINPTEVAELLAQEKAKQVSKKNEDAYVVGADQVMALGSEILGKPENLDQALERLSLLSGKTHQLHTAVCVAHAGAIIWSYTETADMTMREMSGDSIEKYLAAVGDEACKSVGAYQIENLGIHLFTDIGGNYFTILGLCLLPLLECLRKEEIIRP